MADLEGRLCVVTGGARGIGRAVVDAFIAEGAIVHSIDVIAGGPEHARLTQHACDITNLQAVEDVFSVLVGLDSALDILVNNAATITRVVPITELTPDEWLRTLAVNVTGAFNVTRSALPLMRRGARIINIASTFAHVGSPGRVAYSTSKGAILAFTRSLALDAAPLGILVNSVSPGGIATERLTTLFGSPEAAEAHLAPLHPIGHTGRPLDVANAVCFLASGKASFMTGADLMVDGGYTAQ